MTKSEGRNPKEIRRSKPKIGEFRAPLKGAIERIEEADRGCGTSPAAAHANETEGTSFISARPFVANTLRLVAPQPRSGPWPSRLVSRWAGEFGQFSPVRPFG